MHLKDGHKLHNGKYQLLNVLGEGGFSLTYKGIWKTSVQGPLGKVPTQVPVCIKEYFLKDFCLRNEYPASVITNSVNGSEIFGKFKERLIKEARILSEVHHPNIVSVLEVFKENNTAYIVMEFISGQSLKQRVEEFGPLSEEQLLSIIFKIGQALEFIHKKNILHLDIKPSNILINNKQGPILIDFGISKRYGITDSQETSTSILAISKGYASIEQYDSEGMQLFSPCPDIYSLGATMYFLITGNIPTESILRSTKGLEAPRNLRPEISESTEKVILKAMELNPANRYQSVMEMMIDLGYDPEKDEVKFSPANDDDSEKTVLIPNDNQIKDFTINPGDETILVAQNQPVIKKGNKKKWIFPVLLIVILGTIVAYFFPGESRFNNVDLPFTDSNEINFTKHFNHGVSQFSKQNFSQSKEEFLNALKYNKHSVEAKRYISRIDSLTMLILDPSEVSKSEINPENNHKEPNSAENTPTGHPDEPDNNKDLAFNKILNEALVLYNKKDYESAKQLLLKAVKIKKDKDAENYITLCNNEIEKGLINKRKELYEVKMDFGNFVIVRNKSTLLYGAISDDGIEKIQCIYTFVAKSGENRVFTRKDGLYDIYATDGTLVKGATESY